MLKMLEFLQVASGVAEMNGTLIASDEAYATLLGFPHLPPGEFSMQRVTPPEDAGRVSQVMAEVGRTGKPTAFLKRTIRANGEIVWVESRISRLHVGDRYGLHVLTRMVDMQAEAPKVTSPDSSSAGKMAGYISDMAAGLSVLSTESGLNVTAQMCKLIARVAPDEARELSRTRLRN